MKLIIMKLLPDEGFSKDVFQTVFFTGFTSFPGNEVRIWPWRWPMVLFSSLLNLQLNCIGTLLINVESLIESELIQYWKIVKTLWHRNQSLHFALKKWLTADWIHSQCYDTNQTLPNLLSYITQPLSLESRNLTNLMFTF